MSSSRAAQSLLGPLAAFVAVAETGSITKAARVVGITQPALTVAIRKLEETFGTELLLRTARGVSLTSTGQLLASEARHMITVLAAIEDQIDGLEKEERGRYLLGCHESLGTYFLPGFMAKFIAKHPGIELSLWNGTSRQVERAILERVIDLGVVVNPEAHDDLVIIPLFDDCVELVCAAELLKRKRGVQDFISATPLLYVPSLKQVQFILGKLGEQQLKPSRVVECQSMELVKSLVLDGVGIGILPMRVAEYGVSQGKLTRVSNELPSFVDRVTLVRRADMHMTQAARVLIDALRGHGKQLA